MKFSAILPYIDDLQRPAKRHEASRAIAERFGAEEMIIFIQDPLVKVFLPAQGYPQTLPSGKDWRAYLEALKKNENVFCNLKSPFTGTFQAVKGFSVSETAIVVFLGAPPKLALSDEVTAVMSLAAAALQGETALMHSENQTKVLRESAEMYRTLANSMELTKHELQATLQERDVALEELRQTLLERKKANEVDAKISRGTQSLLSTLNYHVTQRYITDLAAELVSDWCVLYLCPDPAVDSVRAAAFASNQEQNLKAIEEYLEAYPEVHGGPTPVGRALQTKTELTYEGLSQARIQALTCSEAQYKHLWNCRPGAILVHPMKQGEQLIGVLVYGFREETQELSTQELLLAQRWTAHSTMAISNANLFSEAQKAIKARDELMSISSHEIRTPITSMKLQIQLAKRQIANSGVSSLGEEKIVKLIEQSDKQLTKLARLVDDMLDLSRINTGQFSIHLDRVSLSGMVYEVLDRLIPHLIAAGCRTTVQVDDGIFVQGDSSRLEQVLTNLLTNAARYGGEKPVHISLVRGENKAVLTVKDEGPGIEKVDLDRIFQKYERAISRNEVSGLGLGLFISRQIIVAHRGAIRAESVLGQGAAFIVELPLA